MRRRNDVSWRVGSMLLGTLGTSLSGNILAGKGMNRAGEGIERGVFRN